MVYTFIVMKAYLDKLSDEELEDLLSNVFEKLLEDFNNIRDVDIEAINYAMPKFVKGLKEKVAMSFGSTYYKKWEESK